MVVERRHRTEMVKEVATAARNQWQRGRLLLPILVFFACSYFLFPSLTSSPASSSRHLFLADQIFYLAVKDKKNKGDEVDDFKLSKEVLGTARSPRAVKLLLPQPIFLLPIFVFL